MRTNLPRLLLHADIKEKLVNISFALVHTRSVKTYMYQKSLLMVNLDPSWVKHSQFGFMMELIHVFYKTRNKIRRFVTFTEMNR